MQFIRLPEHYNMLRGRDFIQRGCGVRVLDSALPLRAVIADIRDLLRVSEEETLLPRVQPLLEFVN